MIRRFVIPLALGLLAVSTGLGSWLAARAGQTDAARLLVVSSVGALLVAFLGSVVAALIPLLLLLLFHCPQTLSSKSIVHP